MGQRLNISIRNKDKTLASGYWHWGGYTDSALHYLNAMSDTLVEYCEEKIEYVTYSFIKYVGVITYKQEELC